MQLKKLVMMAVIASSAVCAWAAPDLPAAEQKLVNDVDHWGLAFSDQLTVFTARFAKYEKDTGAPAPAYIVGIETPLRKTFRNKYWFKGQTVRQADLYAGRNESEAFQLALIPQTGFELNEVQVAASPLRHAAQEVIIPAAAVHLWRVGYVQTVPPQYPVSHVGFWPDPLLELEPFSLTGTDLGLIWYEIKVPADIPAGEYRGTVTVTPANAEPQSIAVNLHVWNFTLPDRVEIPTMVWTKGGDWETSCKVYGLFLEHHLDPVNAGKTLKIEDLDRNLDFCMARGMMRFQTPDFADSQEFKAYYTHLKEKGWLDKALMYAPADEPDEKQLKEIVIPQTQRVRELYPGLKTFLATRYYGGLDQGTDIWLADVSTNFHSWLQAGSPGGQELYWYFCHLPIRTDMERPLVQAPNMEIDNDALEQRLPYWMAFHYRVKGLFIWSGDMQIPAVPPDWPAADLQLSPEKSTFPYAGVHNGNGFLIYPGPRPSIRLKLLRDGIEDYWYLKQVEKSAQKESYNKDAKALLAGLTPALFVDTHYFNRDPDALLAYRLKLGEFIENAQQK